MDIGAWLCGLGLDRYAEAFRANRVGLDVAPDLTDADLATLGVALGDRKRLLRAIAALRGQASRPAPERRQLTVMFVDLVGSTALSGGLDPEEMREVPRAYLDAAADRIARFDGHVAKLMGDGVLAYFGWPRAHEDDAERAVRAGLEVVDAVGWLRTPHGAPLAARVGIATGLVVVGDLIGQGTALEQAVIGATPNLAARLQALADPGTVVVAETTRRLLGGLFECADLGPVEAKGFADPVCGFRVLGEGRSKSRFEALHGASATPLVGRERELATLLDRWKLARAGEGQVVLVAGEPGIGKSHLLQGLCERVASEPHTRLRYFCSPFRQHTAYHPILEQIEHVARLRGEDPPTRKLAKLEALFARSGDSATVVQAAALTATLLGIPAHTPQELSALGPQGRKARLQELWLRQLVGLAAQRPVLMLLEDAHWLDPSSLEQFDLVVDRVEGLRVLLVVTFRPGFERPWSHRAHATMLSLDRLEPRQSAAMAECLAGGRSLPAPVLAQIIAKADGVPLFLEELTKAVLESGQIESTADRWRPTAPAPLAIPASLQDSLMARLDRLAPVKQVAQAAAAIGREFPRELLAAACRLDAATLDHALDQIAAAELIFPRGSPQGTSYVFKHALVQDAAYASLLRGPRRQIHARIAAAMKERPGDSAPEIIAHHLTEAGQADASVEHWARAGELAVSRAANREAAAHFRRAIAQLLTLPETPERSRREAELQDALGGALAHVAGVTSEALVSVYDRASDLCRQIGDRKAQFIAEWNLWHIHVVRGDHTRVWSLGEQLMATAERAGDPDLLLQALHVEWVGLGAKGRHQGSLASCERGWALYDPTRHGSHHLTFGAHDPGVCNRIHGAFALWCLGRPVRARVCYEQGLALARQLGQPLVVLHALAQGLPLLDLWRDDERLGVQAEETLRRAVEQDTANFRLEAQFMRAWLLGGRGRPGEAVRPMQAGLQEHRERGGMGLGLYYRTLLARAQARVGALGEALDTLEGIERSGYAWGQPELLRLRGEFLLAQGDAAEQCFTAAIATARTASARGWELRAATSLARLRAAQGRAEEAEAVLAPVYRGFDEGLDTPDLKEARALLAALR